MVDNIKEEERSLGKLIYFILGLIAAIFISIVSELDFIQRLAIFILGSLVAIALIITVYIYPVLPEYIYIKKMRNKLEKAIEDITDEKGIKLKVGEIEYILENEEKFNDIIGWDDFLEYITEMNRSLQERFKL